MHDPLYLDNMTGNVTRGLDIYKEEKLPQGVIIAFTVIAALTVIVNIFHLSVLYNQPRLLKPAYYNYRLFLITLGSLDLILATVRVILSNDFFQGLLEEHKIFCATSAVYIHITYASMITLIVLVSIDRAYCLKQSVTYQSRKFVKRYPKIIIGVFLFFSTVFITMGIVFHDVGFSIKDVGPCNFGSYALPILAAPTVLLVLVYLFVITGVYIYIIILTKAHIANSKNQREKRRITEVTKTIGAIIIASALCWLPPIISAVLWAAGIHSVELEIYALFMAELNSLANPILYGLANHTYRSVVYKRLTRCWYVASRREIAPKPVKERDSSSTSHCTASTPIQ